MLALLHVACVTQDQPMTFESYFVGLFCDASYAALGGDLKGAVSISSHCLKINELHICIMKAFLSSQC